MSLVLSDAQRYEMEKDGVLAVILAANRRGVDIDETIIAESVNISLSDATRFIVAMRSEGLIE